MRSRSATALALAALGAALGSAAPAHAGYGDQESRDKQVVFPAGSEQPLAALQDIDVIEHLGERVPADLTFSDLGGQPVKLESLLHRDKPVLVTLGYHRCPMLCGLVLDGLVKALVGSGLVLGKDLLAVDISIDPGEELELTAATQKRVLELVGRRGGQAGDQGDKAGRAPAAPSDFPFWLSKAPGDKDGAAARALADAVGFRYKYDPESKQFAHQAVAFVLTPEGIIARYLYGVEYPARDFRMAVVEASNGRVGTSIDKVLLSCYRYDPATRRYAPFVFGFMRIGAALVFVALASLMTVLWRKEIAMKKERLARLAAARVRAAASASDGRGA